MDLRYLATGNSQQSPSFNFRLGRATVKKMRKHVCDALWTRLAPKYPKMPSAPTEWKKLAEKFEGEWNFPNVLGAIDGKHHSIECSKYGVSLYYNYKQFHSIVLINGNL